MLSSSSIIKYYIYSTFLQRVGIARNASAVLAIGVSVRPSVHPSVRPSRSGVLSR